MKQQRLGLMIIFAILLPVLVITLISFVKWDITYFDLSLWIEPARLGLVALVVIGIGIGCGVSDVLGYQRFL